MEINVRELILWFSDVELIIKSITETTVVNRTVIRILTIRIAI